MNIYVKSYALYLESTKNFNSSGRYVVREVPSNDGSYELGEWGVFFEFSNKKMETSKACVFKSASQELAEKDADHRNNKSVKSED